MILIYRLRAVQNSEFTILYKMLRSLTLSLFSDFGNTKMLIFAVLPHFSLVFYGSKVQGIIQFVFIILLYGQITFSDLDTGMIINVHDQGTGRTLLPRMVPKSLPQRMTTDISVNVFFSRHIFDDVVGAISRYMGKMVILSAKNILLFARRGMMAK